MEDNYKIVEFEKYCHNCIHEKVDEGEDPCHECLENTVNLHSHKPFKFEKK